MLARDNHDVDDGWLCDKGRFGFQMMVSEERITQPMIRRGGTLSPVELGRGARRGRDGPARRRQAQSAAIAGRRDLQRGGLPAPAHRPRRAGLAQRRLARRRAPPPASALAELSRPELGAAVSDIDGADSILVLGADLLHSMPILDLRVRKAVRRSGTRAAVATERPTTLDGGAEETARYAPGDAAAFLWTLAVGAGRRRRPGRPRAIASPRPRSPACCVPRRRSSSGASGWAADPRHSAHSPPAPER